MAVAQLIALVLLLAFFSIVGVIVYLAWQTTVGVGEATAERISRRHHIDISKGGLKVAVKDINNEKYVDKSQKWMVDMWNKSGYSLEDKKKRK